MAERQRLAEQRAAAEPRTSPEAERKPLLSGFVTGAAAGPAEEVVPWTATVDPPPELTTWPETPPKIALTLPTGKDELLFTSTPGPFGLAGIDGDEPRRIDLTTAGTPKPAGRMKFKGNSIIALSPDGQFVIRHATQRGPGGGPLVELLDAVKGGSLGKFETSVEG